jgi:hypothetical protein
MGIFSDDDYPAPPDRTIEEIERSEALLRRVAPMLGKSLALKRDLEIARIFADDDERKSSTPTAPGSRAVRHSESGQGFHC